MKKKTQYLEQIFLPSLSIIIDRGVEIRITILYEFRPVRASVALQFNVMNIIYKVQRLMKKPFYSDTKLRNTNILNFMMMTTETTFTSSLVSKDVLRHRMDLIHYLTLRISKRKYTCHVKVRQLYLLRKKKKKMKNYFTPSQRDNNISSFDIIAKQS